MSMWAWVLVRASGALGPATEAWILQMRMDRWVEATPMAMEIRPFAWALAWAYDAGTCAAASWAWGVDPL